MQPFAEPVFADQATAQENTSAPVAVAVNPGPLGDAELATYLEASMRPANMVVVRAAADVPEEIGGMAILCTEPLSEDLRHALLRACGLEPSQ